MAKENITARLTQSIFTIGMGTKGVRAKMGGTVSFDVTKLPPAIVDAIVYKGADILLRQASQEAERVQVKEWCAKHGKKEEDAPAIARFPFDLARLERDAIAAMEKRIQGWYKGELGRGATPMNALERRASELVAAKLRVAFVRNGQAVPDAADLDALVRKVLADPEKGQKYRAEAQAQLLREQEAANSGADELADLITPAPKAA